MITGYRIRDHKHRKDIRELGVTDTSTIIYGKNV
jgi:hypothetical protein